MDKSRVEEVVATLPNDVDLEALIDRFCLLRKIEITQRTCTMLRMPLPPDLREFVKSQLDEGAYRSETEVVVNALYLLRDRTLSRDQRLEQLRAAVKLGLEELDRGEGKPWDKEEVWSEVQRRLDERKAKS